ncbi:putative transposon protein [Symbiodinium microadriaticum]|uniref:Putative transposon protein n=1 Tax=Symbiodinium microadriaticum TaxID=2951 RepID=A0A1Q9D340_SYMMI|nr:putative transposon protein [Symbiodinium microadriaticum]
MDSAGSGLEPNYEAEERQDVSGAGRVPDSTSDTAADENGLAQQDVTSARGIGCWVYRAIGEDNVEPEQREVEERFPGRGRETALLNGGTRFSYGDGQRVPRMEIKVQRDLAIPLLQVRRLHSGSISEAAIKEAAQILQSLRLSAVQCDIKSAEYFTPSLGNLTLTPAPAVQRNVDDVLILRFFTLILLAFESNRAKGIPEPACIVEHPCSELEVKGDLENQCDQEGVSLWNTPEWQAIEQCTGMTKIRFFQGPMGHRKRRPTCLGTNLEPDPVLVECGVPLEVIDYIPERDFGVTAELWTEWAPGLVQARYLIVGVLSVPILAVDGKSVDEPCDADPGPPLPEGGVIDDAEWLADGVDKGDDPDPELPMRELADAREKWNEWDRLVKSSRDDWIEEAQSEHLPKVEIVDFIYVESIERKTHGEVLTAIGRTILQESDSEKCEWPLAAKLAAHELKNASRRRLKMDQQQSLPFNTKVQIISRSWKRETWEARTSTALVKCPTADMSRGWVVATEDNKLLTTGKLFPSIDQGKVSFTSTGPAVDLDAPDYRLKGKTSLKLLQVPEWSEPLHAVDKLAKGLFEQERFKPKDLAELAVGLSQLSQQSSRMVKDLGPADPQLGRRCNFLAGAFSYGGMTGIKSSTKDHPWVTRYLTAYMSKYTDGLYAGVGLILNTDHALHRDLHNQKGVSNIVLPVVTSGGGLWLQDSQAESESGEAELDLEVRHTPDGKALEGRVHVYKAHEAIKFLPNQWHESASATGQQLLLIGYTPRSLHKLSRSDRQWLWQTGFTLLPASKDEFWGYNQTAQVLTRYHPVPRRQMFVPSANEWLPFDRDWIGDVSVLDEVATQHQKVCALLQAAEDEGCEQVTGSVDKLYWSALEALECQGCELQGYESQLLNSAMPVVLRSLSVVDSVVTGEGEEGVKTEDLDSGGGDSSDPPPLQTKIIGADQVRREPEKWVPSMKEEYQSLVSRTGAVQELSDSQYKQLLEDTGVTLEVIPGKLVYVHKSSGRRKSRIVGCGNYCQGGSSERSELYARGAGAESLRLMIRRCALHSGWVLASVDVRTAFLQAPLLEQQREGRRLVTIVRVPSILRETGVTDCKFWRVQKALYGLASAPKSWSSYRDTVLAGLRIPCEGGDLRLSKMLEDANLLRIIRVSSGDGDSGSEDQVTGFIALYVDDILIGAERPICEAVIKALQDQWELSSPEWIADIGDQMKFAGYELQKTNHGIRLHQESYVQDLLEQNEEVVGVERTPAVKMSSFDEVVDEAEKRDITKKSQGLVGQLLWLAGRTRPDLAYAVSMAAQKIVPCPREALARAEHVVKYLRGLQTYGGCIDGGFTSILLALLVLVQANGAKAFEGGHGDVSRLVALSIATLPHVVRGVIVINLLRL